MSGLMKAEALRDYRISRTLGFMRDGRWLARRRRRRSCPSGAVGFDDSVGHRTATHVAVNPKRTLHYRVRPSFRGTKKLGKNSDSQPGCHDDSQTEWRPGFNLSKDARRIETERGLGWMTGDIWTRRLTPSPSRSVGSFRWARPATSRCADKTVATRSTGGAAVGGHVSRDARDQGKGSMLACSKRRDGRRHAGARPTEAG
jgi:hypothetical protein